VAASNITATGATLNGTVNPNGATTTAWFEYGLTADYGSNTPSAKVGSGTNEVSVSQAVVGLRAGTNYHYRLVVTNSGGTSLGADTVFRTASLFTVPTIRCCALLPDGLFQIQFEGLAGASYSVLASTNLTSWEVVGTATETAPGVFEFTDTQAPEHDCRYYQLRSP
jgi:hypothetical protein